MFYRVHVISILLIQWFIVNPRLGGGGGGGLGNSELFRVVRVAISKALKKHFLGVTCPTAHLSS